MFQFIGGIVKLFIIVYILFSRVIGLSSKSSILWKVNTKSGQIDSYSSSHQYLAKEIREIYENDAVFSIIASSRIVVSESSYLWEKVDETKKPSNAVISERPIANNYQPAQNITYKRTVTDVSLDCGHPLGFSFYDDLVGIASRYSHPILPDPEAAIGFLRNKDSKNSKSLKNFNVEALEKRLKKLKGDKPWNAKLFTQIGNFWRIKGDTSKAIDCFRNALIINPSNAEVLHDMGRVLFSLQYLDDAIFLVRRSLESQPDDSSAWRAYFTLGEIFRACGQFQQSILYFRHALDLYPDHEPIIRAINDMEDTSQSSIQFYTIIIIVFLVCAVIGIVVTSNDASSNSEPIEQKPHRHFNRAMAMKSLKGFTSRSIKSRRN